MGEAFDRPATPDLSSPSSAATFKWVVNLDRVISDETVGLAFDALGLAKKCLRVLQLALPANKRTKPLRVELVRYRLDNI
jgi:hypothetical protein